MHVSVLTLENVLQLYKMVEGGVERGMKKVRVHALADGRDVPDGSSVQFFGEIRDRLKQVSEAKGVDACIASGGGRMKVTMDRYEVRFSCIALGNGFSCIVLESRLAQALSLSSLSPPTCQACV